MSLPGAQSNASNAVADPVSPVGTAQDPQPEPGWGKRVTIATMDLKVSITMDSVKTLKQSDLEKIEDDFQAWRKKTRKLMQASLSKYDVDETDTPPEKQMKCGVSGGTWTTSLIPKIPKSSIVEENL